MASIDGALQDLENAAYSVWTDMYDTGDPVQTALGERAWQRQCLRASMALRERVQTIIDQVESELHGGEFVSDEDSPENPLEDPDF